MTDASDHGMSGVLDETVQQGLADLLDSANLDSDKTTVFRPNDLVLITSENVLDAVLQRMSDPVKSELINTLKDKFKCRKLLQDLYPDFYCASVALSDLAGVTLPPGKRFVVKPNRGYFATAIKFIDSATDLTRIALDMEQEIKSRATIFAESVLSESALIIEEYIEGEEYAIDMYYSDDGTPVILNIYHHPIPDDPNYLHALYYTSKPIFDALHDRMVNWFSHLNTSLKATGFPIHAEFRIRGDDILPIELNPLRFGGDGLSELCFHAFGLNPYQAFLHQIVPDWDAIWQGREDRLYTWMMGYVGSDIDVLTYRPNMGEFQGLFSRILSDTLLNYQAHLGFSVIYSEETDLRDVNRLVNTDFKQYFQKTDVFSDKVLSQLYRSGVRMDWAADQSIWSEGDVGDYILMVISGSLAVYTHDAEGMEIPLDTISVGAVVGEYATLDGRPRSASVRAGPDGCAAMRVNGTTFRSILRAMPELFEELYWQQQSRIRKMNARIGALEKQLRLLG